MTSRPLVVALGNPLRGDDGVGSAVAAELRTRPDAGWIDMIELDGEPTRLIDRWARRSRVVVIDAVLVGAAPGTVHVVDLLSTPALRRPLTSTHGSGLGDAVALARRLDRLPAWLTLVGVEGTRFDLGEPLSPAVAAAVSPAATRTLTELGAIAPAPQE